MSLLWLGSLFKREGERKGCLIVRVLEAEANSLVICPLVFIVGNVQIIYLPKLLLETRNWDVVIQNFKVPEPRTSEDAYQREFREVSTWRDPRTGQQGSWIEIEKKNLWKRTLEAGRYGKEKPKLVASWGGGRGGRRELDVERWNGEDNDIKKGRTIKVPSKEVTPLWFEKQKREERISTEWPMTSTCELLSWRLKEEKAKSIRRPKYNSRYWRYYQLQERGLK